ncbi:MAG: hypothetical protein A2Z75_03075 [Chloroflexi bacterium RBG_13_50_10]|nr:MAG: hypothetical protein A2Z75_03075 [Chloroflexi bacterium RBG_13_50_10]
MYEWDSFVWAADEWFIEYSLPPPLPNVKLFAIGHTIELYLKAANTKITEDIDEAIRMGHNIKRIWDDCKRRDQNFMPSFEIRDSVFQSDLFQLHSSEDSRNKLNKDDLLHFYQNQELYIIAKHLPDLKYLGAPLKSIKGAYALAVIHPNPYWITFLKELRGYLGHPEKGKLDAISHHIDEGDLPVQSIQYLKGLYS